MADFAMPSLGADMTTGRLVEWLVGPGDEVKRGDLVAVVDTDKGAMEIEFFEDGVIETLVVAEDTKVPVGTLLATYRPAVDTPAADTRAVATPAREKTTPEREPAAPVAPPAVRPGESAILAVIQPPQVAIVGFGRVADRAWVVDGEVVVRPVLSCTLAADHRATDGHLGGLFLRTIESLLRDPARLDLEDDDG